MPGVVAAVADRARTLYRGAFGLASTALARPMRPDTVFRIASLTKVVTSVAVMMLHEQAGLELDAPFKRYFPAFRQPPVLTSFERGSRRYTTRPAARDITVRELLTHTSGYGYWFLNAELRALFTGDPEYYDPPFVMHEPGSRFQYGIGTDVLGQLIEPVAGVPLAEFLARRIFEPLGMHDTSFALPPETRLASLYAVGARGLEELPNERAPEGPRGGGALYSTVDDFLALLRVLLNDGAADGTRLLGADSVRALTSNQIGGLAAERQTSAAPPRTADFRFMDGTQKFGLGVLIETRDRAGGRAAGSRAAGSYSWAGIYNTHFWVDPRAGIAAVVFMQMSPFCAPACLDVCAAFERAVYEDLVRNRRP